jgi:hypothetical protein
VIEDVQIENAPGDGIQITSLSKSGVALQGSQVNGHISNVFVTSTGAIGIHVVDDGTSVTDWSLLDSWVANSGQSAIYLGNAAGWTVRGNHVFGVHQQGIFAMAAGLRPSTRITSRILAARVGRIFGTELRALWGAERPL